MAVWGASGEGIPAGDVDARCTFDWVEPFDTSVGVDLDLVYDDALEWFVGGALALADELCDLPSRGTALLLLQRKKRVR